MTRSLLAALCAALIATTLLSRAGMAQDFPPGERARALRIACTTDFLRFCRDVPLGGGRIIRCLTRHADLVSQPCFQALTVWGLTAVNAFKMCLPDAERLCAQVPPRSGQALACLLQSADRLSKGCYESLADQGLLNGGSDPRQNGNGQPPRR
jgi:hypothetical protein